MGSSSGLVSNPTKLEQPERTSRSMTVSDWVEKALFIDGKPFKLTNRPYLRRIYDLVRPLVFLKCGRAVEKSTAIGCRMVAFAARYSNFRNLYVSASRQQAVDFSKLQLEQRLQSPFIRERYFDPRICDSNVFLKTFTNGSSHRIRHVYKTPDRVRGLRSDKLCVDEIQDVDTRSLPIVEQVLVQSKFALRLYSGTPKSFENPAEQYWKTTNQCEWFVKCLHCWKWNDGDADFPGLGMAHIGPHGPICQHCGAWLDVRLGRWVASKASEAEGARQGYRIPQLMIPYYQIPKFWKEQILDARDRYSPGQFNNEVLGFSYDDAEKPLTLSEIKRVSIGKWITPEEAQKLPRIPLFGGVDWGTGQQSKTVFTVGGFVSKRKFQVFWGLIFKPSEFPNQREVVREIIRLCGPGGFNVVALGSDFGFGYMQNEELRQALGDDCVWEMQNVNQQRQDVMWNPKSGRFQHNYVQTIQQWMNAVKQERIVFPAFRHWAPFAEQILNARKEFNVATGYTSFRNADGQPDDALHSCNYSYIAARLYSGDWLQRDRTDSRGRRSDIVVPSFLRRGR